MSSQELTSPQVLLHELQSPHSPSKNAESFNKDVNNKKLSNTFTVFHCTIFNLIIKVFVLPLIWTLSSTIWSWTADSCSSFCSLNKVFQDFLLSSFLSNKDDSKLISRFQFCPSTTYHTPHNYSFLAQYDHHHELPFVVCAPTSYQKLANCQALDPGPNPLVPVPNPSKPPYNF